MSGSKGTSFIRAVSFTSCPLSPTNHLKIIYQIVGNFQRTDDFIKYIDERDIIHDWLVDESGEDIAITFETEKEKDV